MGQPEEPGTTPEQTIEQPTEPTESILKQAKRDVRGSGDKGKKIVREYKATGEEWKGFNKK